jgi:hypothetical protein
MLLERTSPRTYRLVVERAEVPPETHALYIRKPALYTGLFDELVIRGNLRYGKFGELVCGSEISLKPFGRFGQKQRSFEVVQRWLGIPDVPAIIMLNDLSRSMKVE